MAYSKPTSIDDISTVANAAIAESIALHRAAMKAKAHGDVAGMLPVTIACIQQ
jgi:hypothetical protein